MRVAEELQMSMSPAPIVSKLRLSIGMKIASGLLAVLAVFVAVAGMAYVNVNHLGSNAGQVTHTYEVLNDIDAVITALVDMETGMRGFALTGVEEFLEPYEFGLTALDENFEAGRTLTLDNPEQTERWDRLAPQLDAIKAESDRIIELRRTEGLEAARDAVMEGEGKRIMDAIRIDIDQLASAEDDLLIERAADTEASVDTTTGILVSGVVVALVTVLAIAAVLHRSVARPLRTVASSARSIASGSLVNERLGWSRSDEVGDLARSFDEMTDVLGVVGEQATAIADAHLTAEVLDEVIPGDLGVAFSTMVNGQRATVDHLRRSAAELATAADGLSSVSHQVGASAAHTADQAAIVSENGDSVSDSVSTVAAAIEEMNATISSVA